MSALSVRGLVVVASVGVFSLACAGSGTPMGQNPADAGTDVANSGSAGVAGNAGASGGAAGLPGAGGMGGSAGGTPIDPTAEENRKAAIDLAVQTVGKLPEVTEDAKHAIDCGTACPPASNTGGLACSSARYAEARRFDQLSVFQPGAAQLWPGNVVNGARALRGELVPIAADLAPVTFSVSLENIAGSPKGTMQVPSLSAFREERNRILSAAVTGSTPAAFSYDIEEISTEQQLNFSLGASFPLSGILNIGAAFDFSSGNKRSKVLLDFTQVYYSIDVDSKTRPANFFTSALTPAGLMSLLTAGEPPVYIQSIFFGRRILMAFESTESRQTLKAAVKATADFLIKVGASVDSGSETVLTRSTVKAVVIGGSGASAAMAVANGVDGIKALIQNGGDYSKESPGAPIGYRLAYLDNAPVKLVLATDYVDTTCTRTSATVRGTLNNLSDLTPDPGSAPEFFGVVQVIVPSAQHDGSCPISTGTVSGFVLVDYERGMYWQPGEVHAAMLSDVPVGTGRYICIQAALGEADVLVDDDYGFYELQLPWGDWEGTHVLQLRNDGNAADVTVTISLP